MKKEDIRKNIVKYGFIGLFIIVAITIFLNFIISREPFVYVDNKNDWIGYYGSVISGVITFIGVFLTISYYRKRDEKSDRLKIRPYLRLDPRKFELEEEKYVDFDADDYTDSELGTMAFEIENIGLGPAIDIEFSELTDHTTNKQEVTLSLKANEKTYFEIFYALKDINKKLNLIIIFKDLYGNKYKQEFVVINDNYIAEIIATYEPELINY